MKEEDTLVECLVELVSTSGWKLGNGMFRQGYLTQLVCMMIEKLPGCRVRVSIVIDCRIKTLTRTFQVIGGIRGPACSGFGWNDEAKLVHHCREGSVRQLFASCREGLEVYEGKRRSQ
ncbi:retrotransposon protein [Cucumis melo var. makuwa]|uniref:Retrotransposon protein n=1 Tax=Cucumis melo var. makuwa TaxID=1194695 RepID=A0A5A7TFL5_CUCMM|nr:retrotransposon protein [Cucumis melo var. makuwa]TYK23366.1 retrotransposon protein [Cucumis melo var. makuwa]